MTSLSNNMSSNNLPTLLWNKLKFVVIGPPGFLCDWQGSVYFKEKFLRGVEFSDHCRENKAIRRRAVEQYNKEGGQWWIFAGASYVRKATDKEIGKWVTYQHNNMKVTSDYRNKCRTNKQRLKEIKADTKFQEKEEPTIHSSPEKPGLQVDAKSADGLSTSQPCVIIPISQQGLGSGPKLSSGLTRQVSV